LPTLCGSRFRQGHRASEDAVAVARLRRHGAVVIGKTNCPEMLASYETDNYVTGRTNHPKDLERTPGGSSGGEAAAIASGFSAGGIGSDGGGSIRWPAHCCGIAGLKPTPGRVPATGHYPLIQHPGGLLGVIGPMARSAADVRELFHAMEGYQSSDPFSVPATRIEPPPDIRIGVMESFYEVLVQAEIRDAVRRAARIAESLGYVVEPYMPRGIERAPNVWSFFFTELAAPFTREMIAGRESEAHWTGTEFYDAVKDKPEPTGKQVVENLGKRDAMRRHLLAEMPPIVIAPAAGVTAFRHRERRFDAGGSKRIGLFQAMMPLTWVNLFGLPAIVIPFGEDASGMPVGIQLIGHPWHEELLLDTAVQLEQERGT
jgi:Asp-tRNA(Asn)/Glu-tRNA(Gln) amidotransferase A subunit family amidase